MTPKQIAQKIGMPVDSWPGKCHEIAGLCLVAGVTTGTLRYGLWHGPVGGRRDGLPVHHGWVEVEPAAEDESCEHCPHVDDEHAGHGIMRACTIKGCDCEEYLRKETGPRVFDPTRYVFEGKGPYVFDAVDDLGYYDVAGDRQRELTMKPLTAKIAKGVKGGPVTLKVDLSTQLHLASLIAPHTKFAKPSKTGLRVPRGVATWLATLPMSILGPFAEQLYMALADAGLRAAIPIDCREFVFGDGFYGQRAKFEARIARVMETEPRRVRR